ncbi:MAG TPA: PPC domain-containing DNA-binding protein [Chloroflexota bacterium]|nr:PPC domain-containing DNA-binding protein [Chloroflexota bacterium]
MQSKLIDNGNEKTFAVVFDEGDEVMGALQAFAEQSGITAAQITGIGAFSDVTLGFFDRKRKEYLPNRIAEQVEVVSLVGDISVYQGKPKVHVHAVVAKRDATAYGGHLLEAKVWPTLELIVVESPKALRRTWNPEAGLPLIDLKARRSAA